MESIAPNVVTYTAVMGACGKAQLSPTGFICALSENLCFCVFDVTPHESDVLIPNSCPGSRDSFCQRPDETGRQVTVRCAVP